MANKKITDLAQLGSIDRATDVLEIVDVSADASFKTTINALLGITGAPVGLTDSQTLTNKTLTAPTLTSPVLNGTITGTYTLGGTVTFPATVVTTTGTQTLTNKTLSSATLSTPTLTNASISADAITGFTTANSGTIYGVPITAGALNGNNISTNSINGSKINWSATGANAGIWLEELGRTTLAVAGSTITVSGFTPRKYLRFYADIRVTGTVATQMRINNDSGGNYGLRYTLDNTVGAASDSVNNIGNFSGGGTFNHSIQGEILNITTTQKTGWAKAVNGNTGGGRPSYVEFYFQWNNVVNPVTRIDIFTGTGSLAIGSELVILGHD